MDRASFRAGLLYAQADAERLADEFLTRKAILIESYENQLENLSNMYEEEIRLRKIKMEELWKSTKTKKYQHRMAIQKFIEHEIEDALDEALESVAETRDADIYNYRNERIKIMARMANDQLLKTPSR